MHRGVYWTESALGACLEEGRRAPGWASASSMGACAGLAVAVGRPVAGQGGRPSLGAAATTTTTHTLTRLAQVDHVLARSTP